MTEIHLHFTMRVFTYQKMVTPMPPTDKLSFFFVLYGCVYN